MAKKKQTEKNKIVTTADVDSSSPLEIPMSNGLGVGVYYDDKTKKFVLVTLDLIPDSDSAVITSKQKLNSSKLNATLKATITLEQLLNKMK